MTRDKKMPSLRKIEANRRNAKRSTGPRTAAGKARVRYNAYKHGITGGHFVISNYESYAEFSDLLQALISDRRPCSAVEDLLVDSIARCYWRLRRIDNAEQAKILLELKRIGPPLDYSQREGETLEEFAKRAVDDDFREDALRAGLMLPPIDMDLILRYRASERRHLFQLLSELERVQRIRKGEYVAPPSTITLKV
jgi:hypothetical protein